MSCGLSKVGNWVDLAIVGRFRPAKVAALAGRSLRQFQRFCQDMYHKTPTLWLRELQCHLARELLERGYSHKEIVAELWFADQAQFCRWFKKIYGVAPGSYGLPSPKPG